MVFTDLSLRPVFISVSSIHAHTCFYAHTRKDAGIEKQFALEKGMGKKVGGQKTFLNRAVRMARSVMHTLAEVPAKMMTSAVFSHCWACDVRVHTMLICMGYCCEENMRNNCRIREKYVEFVKNM